VDRDAYAVTIRQAAPSGDRATWMALWDALTERADWRFEMVPAIESPQWPLVPLWSFGPPPGTSHLGLRVQGRRFALYVAAADGELRFDDLDELLAWLDVHEDEHRQYSASERDMIEHLYGEKGPPPDKG
jgi:hypothetical protein